MIEFGHGTHVGLRREHNEDTYYADAELGLWLVADGMGGHEFGEVASALARDAVVREVRAGHGRARLSSMSGLHARLRNYPCRRACPALACGLQSARGIMAGNRPEVVPARHAPSNKGTA